MEKAGIVELTPWLIRFGYARGIFPMTMDDGRVEWFQPIRRCLFPMSGLRMSRTVIRSLKRPGFELRFDTEFELVMRNCMRPGDNWISEDFIRVYTQIHYEGWAHSAETWQDGELVGGVYGLALGKCFCAESMFHRRTDASKFALSGLIDRCRDLGFDLFDAQVMNPHLASLGAFEISNEKYLKMLSEALKSGTEWGPAVLDPT